MCLHVEDERLLAPEGWASLRRMFPQQCFLEYSVARPRLSRVESPESERAPELPCPRVATSRYDSWRSERFAAVDKQCDRSIVHQFHQHVFLKAPLCHSDP